MSACVDVNLKDWIAKSIRFGAAMRSDKIWGYGLSTARDASRQEAPTRNPSPLPRVSPPADATPIAVVATLTANVLRICRLPLIMFTASSPDAAFAKIGRGVFRDQ
jgi:hypothetical protein